MAGRPLKKGVDWFKLYVNKLENMYVKALTTECGLEAGWVYMRTLGKLCQEEDQILVLTPKRLGAIASDIGIAKDKLIEIWRCANSYELIEFDEENQIISSAELKELLEPLLKARENDTNAKKAKKQNSEQKTE